jgi:hypothetical protein
MSPNLEKIATSTLTVAALTISFSVGLKPTPVLAWERGLNAGSWTKGATLKVFVDDIPADAPDGTSDAVDEAIKEWNDAQASFGGLVLMRTGATKDNADIHISWTKNDSTTAKKDNTDKNNNGFAKETVRMAIKTTGNSRAVTRRLKHEFGHAEGLGHSAKSALMKANAYSNNKNAPTLNDMNSNDPFISPTDDDKAGKKSLWGTKEKLSESEDDSSVKYDGALFIYYYNVHALDRPGLVDPVTEFTITMLAGIGENDFIVSNIPSGWKSLFFDGNVKAGDGSNGNEFLDDYESPSPSLLSFLADSPSLGIYPGQTFNFQISSPFGPGTTRAFTNSPNFDSDEFTKMAPSKKQVPVPAPLPLFGFAAAFGWSRKLRKYSRILREVG